MWEMYFSLYWMDIDTFSINTWWHGFTTHKDFNTFGYRGNVYSPRGVNIDKLHYNDVTMSAMSSQITRFTIVYSTVYTRHRSKKTLKLRVTGLCAGNSPLTGEFPTQRASNAENISIWWHLMQSLVESDIDFIHALDHEHSWQKYSIVCRIHDTLSMCGWYMTSWFIIIRISREPRSHAFAYQAWNSSK